MRNVDIKNQSVEALVISYQTTKNNASFGELYNRYYNNLFAYCKKIIGNREDAYDITTNTFIKATEKIHQLSSPEQFPSWLFRIAHNMCMDNGKKNKKNRTAELDNKYDRATEDFDMEKAIEKETKLAQLEILMNQIDPEAKQLLIEKYMNKKTIPELVTQYQLSSSAIKMRLARARNKIAQLAIA